MASPSVDAALRAAAAQAASLEPNPSDVRLATYGTQAPNLAQTVGYDDYMRHINNDGLPIVRSSGSYYSPAGAREGYENYGIPPVLRHSSPFATAGYRTFVDPFGQMMVQPLVGFPSAYPHVLSGVPMNPFYSNMYAMQMGPLGYPFGFGMGMPPMPPGAPMRRKIGNGNKNRNTENVAPSVGNMGWARGDIAPAAETRGYVSPDNQAWMASLEVPPPTPQGIRPHDIRGDAAPVFYDWGRQVGDAVSQIPTPADAYNILSRWLSPPAPAQPAPVPGMQAPVSGATVNPDGSWSGGIAPPEYNFRQGQMQQVVPVEPTRAPELVPIPDTVAMLGNYYG